MDDDGEGDGRVKPVLGSASILIENERTPNWQPESNSAMNEGKDDPLPEDAKSEQLASLPNPIDLRMLESKVDVARLVQEVSEETLPRSKERVVEHGKPIQKEDLPTKSIESCKVELSKHQDNIFVEVVADHLRDPHVAEPSMIDE